MRSILLALAALAASASPVLAQGGGCAVAGSYRVLGQSPGQKGLYKGTATIEARNGHCEMRWGPPNNSFGVGRFEDGFLAIHFGLEGRDGVVVYTKNAKGGLDGVWWMKNTPEAKGTESLIPDRGT